MCENKEGFRYLLLQTEKFEVSIAVHLDTIYFSWMKYIS